jgi:pyrroloquinoline quinone biosynthesis protein A
VALEALLVGVGLPCCAKKNFIVYFGAAFLIKLAHNKNLWRVLQMKWETPAYNDMRFGFEVTMYIYNR